MHSMIRVSLETTPQQAARLSALRTLFAQVCNELAPHVQRTRVWNRVVLHHAHYRQLREKFPALGSQMVCNAIYAVSKMARLVYQSPASPYNLNRIGRGRLPLLRFSESCPVYFDSHTLSIRQGRLSLYTLDGRMHFHLTLAPSVLETFSRARLREIFLSQRPGGVFELVFVLLGGATMQVFVEPAAPVRASTAPVAAAIPDYLIVEEPA